MPPTSQPSPVLCETSPPPHTWSSPDLTSAHSVSQPHPVQPISNASMPDRPTRIASEVAAEQEESSDSESSSNVSAETPRTASTPRSDPVAMTELAMSSETHTVPIPDHLPESSAETEMPVEQNESNQQNAIPAEEEASPLPEMPPPPPQQNETEPPPVRDNIPEWVKYEEDTSVPNEAELKEIEAKTKEPSAIDFKTMEKSLFTDIDDPEIRPVKKLRLSWTIKGVRGTREKPNRARIMVSPTFEHEGKHWNIKFFPRGNKSRSSMAAFIRCSNNALKTTNEDILEGNFTCYAGDADDEELEQKVSICLTPSEPEASKTEAIATEIAQDAPVPTMTNAEISNLTNGRSESSGSTESRPSRTRVVDDDDSSDDSSSGSDDEDIVIPDHSSPTRKEQEDFRVSAQLGIVIYNPDEPRTFHEASSEHQFCPHEDDWGWDSLVSRWEEIHRRKPTQRQALLRNDTLVIDAYIRIYDDPSKALFWHASTGESQWDSKLLAGYHPMGTRLLYHSPAVAGITAWSLLAPFRQIIQNVDAGKWRSDSSAKPRPLIANLQLMLFQMRQMNKEEVYIHLDNLICEIMGPSETFDDVQSFWEVLARSIELELEGDDASIAALHEMLGSPDRPALPVLPVQGVQDMQQAVDQGFGKAAFAGELPDFLPLMLDRQSFDHTQREWKMHHDRVHLSEEVDLSRFYKGAGSKYTLYGFMVHDGERNSGKFYSIVRPAGPGGMWLAFSDGNGNKVFSYTHKSLREFEGLEGDELKKFSSTRQTAYMAMYVRTNRLKEYLTPSLEEYRLPNWLKPYLEERYYHSTNNFESGEEVQTDSKIKVEVFWDASIVGHEGTLNMFNMKTNKRARSTEFHQTLTSASAVTFSMLKAKIASILEQDESRVHLWTLNYYRLGQYSKAYMHPESPNCPVGQAVSPGETLCLWLAVNPEDGAPVNDSIKSLFTKINGTEIEAPLPAPEDLSGQHDSHSPDAAQGTSVSDSANLSQVQEDSTNANVTVTNSENIQDTATSASTTEDVSPVDAEQTSVHQAVTMDLENATSTSQLLVTPVSDTIVNTNEVTELPVLPFIESTPQGSNEVANREQRHQSLATQEQNTSNNVLEAEVGGMNTLANDLETEFLTTATTDPSMEATVVTVATALGEIPADISAEDAALISSMIAADMEAAEMARLNIERAETQARLEITGSRPSTPPTPRQQPRLVYAFLQYFSSETQTIVAKAPFFAERSGKISDAVRKQCQYEADQKFEIWRREGACGAASVGFETTFADLQLQDGCDIIIGDVLSDSRIAELKQKGEFATPGGLIKYIVMTRHRHPIFSKTSDGSVELAGFGTDYYKGPLVRGQKHGTSCLSITSNGEKYEGPMLCGQKNGAQGKMTYQNGDSYTGDWLDDLRHGQGEFVEKRTGNRYVGGYEDDKRWGRGVTYWEMADQQADLCQICYFQDVDSLFYECGHVCACYVCAKDCDYCPICRKTIRAVVKMYRA